MSQIPAPALLHTLRALEVLRRGPRPAKLATRGALRMTWPQVLKWIPPLQRIPFRAQLITGDDVLVSLPDDVSVALYRYGYFEADVLAFALHHSRLGDVIFDVGSHVGSFAVICSRIVGPSGRVLAIEPTPRTFAILRENCRIAANLECLEAAVCDRPGQLELTDFGPGGAAYNRVGSTAHRSLRRLAPQATVAVSAVTLDSLMPRYERVDLIKLDVEDAEMAAVAGGEALISGFQPGIILEVGDAGTTGKSRKVLDQLRSWAPYDIYEWDVRAGLAPHSLRSAYGYGNLLLTTRVVPTEPGSR